VILAFRIPDAVFALVAAVAGAIASVTGFGIGSLLTPLLALELDARAAVAIVSVPHLAASVARFATLWRRADRRVVITFGSFSVLGSLAGALLAISTRGPTASGLGIAMGLLLMLGGFSALAAPNGNIRFGRKSAGLAGVASGFFGGLVGSQGPIRSAALLAFDISKESFLATAMAIAIVVDLARIPVYLSIHHGVMAHEWKTILLATAGTLAGTLWGNRILRAVPVVPFRRAVACLVFVLGAAVLVTALRPPSSVPDPTRERRSAIRAAGSSTPRTAAPVGAGRRF
jgi:uncharacterized membrane protein YfcA